jgi:hypothetical protein
MKRTRLRLCGIAVLVLVAGLGAQSSTAAGPLPSPPLPPLNVVAPSIAGSATAGSTVTCTPGQWLNSPTSYLFSWQRNLVTTIAEPGPGNQYTLTDADAGQLITCTVTAGNANGSSQGTSLPIIPGTASSNPSGNPSSPSGPSGGGGGGVTAAGLSGPSSGPGKPALLSFSVSPRRMVVLVHRRYQSTKGVTLHYSLDQTATVVIVIEQRVTGHLVGNRCVRSSRPRGRAKACAGFAVVKTLTVRARATRGADLTYSGGKHLLPNGTYRALAAAVAPAGWSSARQAGFTVTRRRAAR